MNELDRENMQALREIRNLSRAIYYAAKVIREQQKIKRDAEDRFKGLLSNYPHARAIYYSGI